MIEISVKPVLVCDTQPVAIEGVRGLLSRCDDLRFAGAVSSLEAAFELTNALSPAAVVIDKSFGTPAITDWLHRFSLAAETPGTKVAPVIWGMGINESEALRFLQAGARGVLRRTSEPETLVTCLRSVTGGNTWLEDGIFGESDKLSHPRRSQLTPREMEIAELVEKGLRNRDIANNLGIRTGTVKIHLKHIFEKTGVRGRYGLALNGLREKGTIDLAPAC
ncbi:MAG TPA: response regulator transcription factor [Bryobacteraceae bacterium]|nr:response regulator transcription factor [Bryobacteraceae bacterium]